MHGLLSKFAKGKTEVHTSKIQILMNYQHEGSQKQSVGNPGDENILPPWCAVTECQECEA